MSHMLVYTLLMNLLFTGSSMIAAPVSEGEKELREKARYLARKMIIVDTHIDVPYRLESHKEDISVRTVSGDFDFVRAKEGGLNAPFMSIYIPAEFQKKGGAKAYADKLIDLVESFQLKWPDKFSVATSVQDVRDHFKKGLVSLPMGMENGAPIENDLKNLKHFHERGIRYITLTHGKYNHICDSSYDPEKHWNGLSPFGYKAVAEMNRLGIMVDISHVSDSTFYQVMRVSKAPVIASHSSARAFTPGWERNMNDDMIKLLAQKDGVIMITFGSSFLRTSYRAEGDAIQRKIDAHLEKNKIRRWSEEGIAYFEKVRKTEHVGTIDDVVEHIAHVVDLVGIDHVGLGSDFDGVFALPKGLQDVSFFPNLIYELLKKGYSEADIRKICGENLLRVWKQVENVAAQYR